MNNPLIHRGQRYFINGQVDDQGYRSVFLNPDGRKRTIESCESDYFLCRNKFNFFNPKHLHNGFQDLEWVSGFFKDLKQPTENDVRRAMLLSISDYSGDGSDHRYCLKAGGGSMSDSQYSSSLSILIANRKSGLDQWVVLIKKFSTVFSEVIITYQDIHALFEMIATAGQKETYNLDQAKGIVGLLYRAVHTGKMNYTTGRKRISEQEIERLIETVKGQQKATHLQTAINRIEDNLKRELTYELIENQPGDNARYKARTKEQLRSIQKLRTLFFPEFDRPKVSLEQLQLCL